MDASSLPVLTRWAPGGSPQELPWPVVPDAMDRVEAIAPSVEEALSRVRLQFPGRDAWLLRADAVLPVDAWDRLAATLLAAGKDWDVVSPVDGSWRLFADGTDDRTRDALAWAHGEHAVFACRAWSRVCSLWRAEAIAVATPPDGDGLRRGLLPCLYVGPAQAPRGDELPLPLASLQSSVEGARPGLARPRGLPVLLHVLHDWGGGVERFARDLAAADDSRQHLLLVARGHEHRAPFGRRLCLHQDLDAPPVRAWSLARPIEFTDVHSPEVQAILTEVLDEWGVGAVLVSSLIGHSLDVLRTGLPTAVCTHDVHPAWPLLHDTRDPDVSDFDLAALRRGLEAAGAGYVFAGHSAERWWSLRTAYLDTLADSDALLIAPSDAARARLCGIAPLLSARRWQVIPHGMSPLPMPPPTAGARSDTGAPLRVLVPGRIDEEKGERLIARLLEGLPADVELMLLGCGRRGARFEGTPRIQVHPDYVREDLPEWIARLAPDIALLPSTVPETFSYTLSEMRALGIPVLCASPGAPADRVRREGGGWVVEPDAAQVNALLARLAAHREEIQAIRDQPPVAEIDSTRMARQWQAALPAEVRPLRLGSATPSRLNWLAQRQDAMRQSAVLGRTKRELHDAWLELDRRAAWALSLQGELDSRTQQLSAAREQELELARLEEYIRALDQQLADAHGYYQRDSNDLAQQRDVAIRQRDEAQASLQGLLSSPFWRATALPRRIARGIRNRVLAGLYHFRHFRSLAARGLTSLRVRGVSGTLKRLRQRRSMRADTRHLVPLQTGTPADSALRLLRPRSPRASVIVPVYNQLHFTLACLRALADCGDKCGFEVIVVDDASSDGTARVLPSIPGLRYHRNAENLGFIGACNAGAELATGEFLVFLNNDTTVLPGWLDALLDTFASHPDTGLAGSKLVYPDGRLQEAGGIVFSDGSGWNYGRFEDPAHPRFNFVREVDYCSGAAIALRREHFLQLQGFDTHYAPAYYEDTDLAMRVRGLGLKVRYQPASTVIHHEGISAGTDLQRGMKAYQTVNKQKFLDRWRDVLQSSHASPESDPELAADRGRRRRVLVLDACTPTPDRDSGSVRMLALMRVLREEGCSVLFFPENRAHDGAYTSALQQAGIECWWHPYLGDVPRWLAAHGASFDMVIVSRHYVLSPLVGLIRNHARQAQLIFDTVDLHHVRELREAEVSGDPAQHRAAARTRKIELGLIAQCDRTWVVSATEKAMLAERVPGASVDVVSNIHQVHGPGLPHAQRSGLLFVGSFRHPPNVDATLWMAREIFPLIHQARPDIELHLVGADAPEDVEALGRQAGIRFHGYVPDLQPLLVGTRVGVAPLRYGAGVKGKVNQSLAHGLPMVATPCAVEGMHLVDGVDVLVATDAASFAQAVLRLYDDEVLWQALAEGGLENTRRHFSTDAVRTVLLPLIEAIPGR